ncbi:MAG: hypothetical protein ACRDRX_25845 [Pseudonocardiaceae bacterium]
MRRAARSWPAELSEYLADRPLAWWQAEKLARGAQATVLAAQASEDGTWRAAAVGDSCLFHCRGDDVLGTFPVTSAAAFDSRPDLVVSTRVELCRPRSVAGRFVRGDLLVLTTDALAAWAMHTVEMGHSPVETFRALTAGPGNQALAAWVSAQRSTERSMLRNDDITVVTVELVTAR